MTIPLGIEYPGAYYHEMNRGNRREDIFLAGKDRKKKDQGRILNFDFKYLIFKMRPSFLNDRIH